MIVRDSGEIRTSEGRLLNFRSISFPSGRFHFRDYDQAGR
jgi:hypothetical protein